VTAKSGTAEARSALIPGQGSLTPAPAAWERLYLDAMTPPSPKGITGWLAWLKRSENARQLGDEIFAGIQKAFQEALLARYNLSLQLDQGLMEEHIRLQLARARALSQDLMAKQEARQMVARRLQMVRQLIEIQSMLKKMGVPEETVDRKIGQYVERLIDALGTEMTKGGNNGTDQR
jgi:CRP-like cAMP-binding protein